MTKTFSKQKKIAVIGLGYVGLPLAIEFGRVRSVVGYDLNKERINELLKGLDRTLECSPEKIIAAKHLQFALDEIEIGMCQVFIVTVPTPIDESKKPDLNPLKKASETIGRHLKPGDIVIYESTVFPGATEEFCVPILEEVSGLKFNKDFFCGYSPERINPGDKINTITKIKKVVSGSNPDIADEIDAIYNEIITAGTFKVSSIKVAEASKVIENTQRDLNIAFVNELSLIFDRLGIDTLEVLEASGTKWNFLPFRPGIVGGHCIGIDPYYLTYKAEQVGYKSQIILAGRRMNDSMARYAARNLIKRMAKQGINIAKSNVGVLGVTFKENCPDIRNSKVFDMIDEFESWGVTVFAKDSWANPEEVLSEYGVKLEDNIKPKSLDAVIVAVGHSEFRELKPTDLQILYSDLSRAVLGDLKSLYNKHECLKAGFDTFRL